MKISPKDRAKILFDTIYYSILLNNGSMLDAKKNIRKLKNVFYFFVKIC